MGHDETDQISRFLATNTPERSDRLLQFFVALPRTLQQILEAAIIDDRRST